LASLFAASPASAITVDSTGESGFCTLRKAIVAVNMHDSSTPCGPVAGVGQTTINLPANTYTITGELQIAAGADVAIVGANSNLPDQTVIDAGGNDRVLEILSGGSAFLSGVTVRGGRTANGTDAASAGQYGGYSADGGGILNRGQLTLEDVLLTANSTGNGGRGASGDPSSHSSTRDARDGGWAGSGGGIYNAAGA